jgi:hypothetical protein
MAEQARSLDRSRALEWKYSAGGLVTYMYIDSPGEFYDGRGNPVGVDHARASGFDVNKLIREKAIADKKKEAIAQIEKDMRSAMDKKEVRKKEAGLQLVQLGNGQYMIEDSEGRALTPSALPEKQAEALFKRLTEDETKEMKEVKTPDPEKPLLLPEDDDEEEGVVERVGVGSKS